VKFAHVKIGKIFSKLEFLQLNKSYYFMFQWSEFNDLWLIGFIM